VSAVLDRLIDPSAIHAELSDGISLKVLVSPQDRHWITDLGFQLRIVRFKSIFRPGRFDVIVTSERVTNALLLVVLRQRTRPGRENMMEDPPDTIGVRTGGALLLLRLGWKLDTPQRRRSDEYYASQTRCVGRCRKMLRDFPSVRQGR